MMKKYFAIVFVLMATLYFLIKDTEAVTFAENQINDIYFYTAENWVDANGDQQISTGDYFYGILNVQNISDRSAGTVWNYDNVTPGLDTFTGYFITEVVSVTSSGILPSVMHITFGTYTGGSDPFGILSDTELDSGVVLKMWTDTSTKWTNKIDIATDIANSTDGTPWATFTADGGYWYTHAPVIPPGSGNPFGESFLGLNLVDNFAGYDFALVNDPNESERNLDVYLTGQSEIEVGTNYWGFRSNDPAIMSVVPEPISSILFVAGGAMLGARSFLRRRQGKG